MEVSVMGRVISAVNSSVASSHLVELMMSIAGTPITNPEDAVRMLGQLRDGIITGEGPTTRGRIHFSRSIDAIDAALASYILCADALDGQAVTRAEADALFQIDEAASERNDEGRFDDLFAKAIVHHATAASGLPVPPRAIALSADTSIENWAPTQAVGVDTNVLEWIDGHFRTRRRPSRTLMAVVTLLVGATTLPLAQSVSTFVDLGL